MDIISFFNKKYGEANEAQARLEEVEENVLLLTIWARAG